MNIILLTGKCASGKDTLMHILKRRYGAKQLVSYTTRAMRPGEMDGREYFFTNREDFQKKLDGDEFIEIRRAGKGDDEKCYGLHKTKNGIDGPGLYVTAVDPPASEELCTYFNTQGTRPIVVLVDTFDDLRKQRALARGGMTGNDFDLRDEQDREMFTTNRWDFYISNNASKQILEERATSLMEMLEHLDRIERCRNCSSSTEDQGVWTCDKTAMRCVNIEMCPKGER